tara:strand:+ start:5380 stop:5709 length:330 start_codon:yes stop_codon:yes gene_type:complete
MNTRSRKAKGRRLQNQVRETLIERLDIHPEDIKTAVMGESGEDIIMARQARERFPFSVECKAHERLNIWEAIKQAEDNSGDHTPIVIFKRNRSKTYVTIELDNFLDLIE